MDMSAAIWKLNSEAELKVFPLAHQYGLTGPQFHALVVLYRSDGLKATELAHAMGRAATSFTPILDGLIAAGYAERRADPVDRRAVRIHLLPKAQSVRAEILSATEAIDADLRSAVRVWVEKIGLVEVS